MTKDDIIAARLDIIAAKARILTEKYKNNQLWGGELETMLGELSSEISAISGRNKSSHPNSGSGCWFPDDK